MEINFCNLSQKKNFTPRGKDSPAPGEVDLRSKDGEGEDAALNHVVGGLH